MEFEHSTAAAFIGRQALELLAEWRSFRARAAGVRRVDENRYDRRIIGGRIRDLLTRS
jgi:hypothetical protein